MAALPLVRRTVPVAGVPARSSRPLLLRVAGEAGWQVTRETAAEKAKRILIEGRLIVRELDEHGGTVAADCRGDATVHSLGRDNHGWFCSCKARGRCSHLLALGSVVALGPREAQP